MRRKRLYYNTASSLLNQIVALISGFIIPRLILGTYGSDVNGLVSSITQFLGFIALLDMGVGAVVQAAYYKPLAEKNNRTVSLLFNQSKSFFRIIASILLVYVAILCFVFPVFINTSYDYSYTVLLILSISVSLFAQYYFAVPHQLLLNADQRLYIQSNAQIAALVLNTVSSAILMVSGCSIQTVKLMSSIVFLIRPIFLATYVKKHYKIDYSLKNQNFKIEQKWNGLAQHCATVVMNNTDVMVLSVFSTMKDVSIYSVYYLVVNGIKQLINALSGGFNSLLGNILACNEEKLLKETFEQFEWIMHTLVIAIFSITGLLLPSFILCYTKGIIDANYYQPLFAVLMTISQAIYCIRIPYNTMITSAGHYKQTQMSAVVEVIINVIISVILVYKYGLIGVTIGTLIAMVYRTIYFICYLHNNIIGIKYSTVVKQVFADCIQIILIIIVDVVIRKFLFFEYTYIHWIGHATIICLCTGFIIAGFNIIVYKARVINVLKKIKKR